MKKISDLVNGLIKEKPFISEALMLGIINSSALARLIQQDIEESLKRDVKLGALIMAINRYAETNPLYFSKKLKYCLDNLGDIILRSGLSDYTYKNSESLFKKHISLVNKINFHDNAFFTYVQGLFESSYVVSESIAKLIEKNFDKEKIVSYTDNLSAITIRLPKENIKTAGLYYHLLRDIAWEGINVIDIISTSNEFSILIHNKEIDKAFSIIKKIKHNY